MKLFLLEHTQRSMLHVWENAIKEDCDCLMKSRQLVISLEDTECLVSASYLLELMS